MGETEVQMEWLVPQLESSRVLRARKYHERLHPDEKPSQSGSWNLRMTVTLAERQGGARYLKCRMSRGR